MALAFRASASAKGTGTSLAVNKPTGTVENDVIILAVGIDSTPTLTFPSGFTSIIAETGHGNRLEVAWKVAGPSEPSTYTVSWTGSQDCSIAISSYSGGATTSPIDVSGSNTGTGASVPAPSITTTVADTMLVFLGSGNDAYDAIAYTPPSGMTEREDLYNNTSNITLADEVRAASGATGTRVGSHSPNEGLNTAGILLAILPLVVSGATGKSNPLHGPLGGPLVGVIG